MIERFASVWLGITVIAGWSFVCIVLALGFTTPPERAAILGLWLSIVAPFGFAMYRMRRKGCWRDRCASIGRE